MALPTASKPAVQLPTSGGDVFAGAFRSAVEQIQALHSLHEQEVSELRAEVLRLQQEAVRLRTRAASDAHPAQAPHGPKLGDLLSVKPEEVEVHDSLARDGLDDSEHAGTDLADRPPLTSSILELVRSAEICGQPSDAERMDLTGSRASEVQQPLTPLEKWCDIFMKLMYGRFQSGRASRQSRAQEDLEMLPVWGHNSWGAATPKPVGSSTFTDGKVVRRLSFDEELQLFDTRAGDILKDDSWLQPFVVHPTSPAFVAWSLSGLFFILVDVIAVPLLVFDMGTLTFPLMVLSLITFLYWLVDMPSKFMTGYDRIGCTEMRPRRVAWNYLAGWFTLDLIIIMADFIILVLDLESGGLDQSNSQTVAQAGNRSLRIVRITRIGRLLRLMRLGKLKKLWRNMHGLINSEHTRLLITIMQSVAAILVINHYVACTFYAVAVFSADDIHTWVKEYDDKIGESVVQRYIMALHWSLTQFAPATNNVVPQNLGERIFAVLVVIFALIVFSSFVSRITNAVNQVRRFNAERYNEEARVHEFIYARKISTPLSIRVNHFISRHFNEKKRRVHEEDIKVFNEIPESMRIQLHEEVYLPRLRESSIFVTFINVDKGLMSRICHRCMAERAYSPRQDVFLYDAVANSVYVVEAGTLQYRCDEYYCCENETIRKGRWVSEMAFWIQWKHCGQLTAETSSDLVAIDLLNFHLLMTSFGGPLYSCLRRLAIFLVGYAETQAEKRDPVTDTNLPPDLIKGLAHRSYRLWDMQRRGNDSALNRARNGPDSGNWGEALPATPTGLSSPLAHLKIRSLLSTEPPARGD